MRSWVGIRMVICIEAHPSEPGRPRIVGPVADCPTSPQPPLGLSMIDVPDGKSPRLNFLQSLRSLADGPVVVLLGEEDPVSDPKVFGIGFQKTGTSSLKRALRQLGYRVSAGWRLGVQSSGEAGRAGLSGADHAP